MKLAVVITSFSILQDTFNIKRCPSLLRGLSWLTLKFKYIELIFNIYYTFLTLGKSFYLLIYLLLNSYIYLSISLIICGLLFIHLFAFLQTFLQNTYM